MKNENEKVEKVKKKSPKVLDRHGRTKKKKEKRKRKKIKTFLKKEVH